MAGEVLMYVLSKRIVLSMLASLTVVSVAAPRAGAQAVSRVIPPSASLSAGAWFDLSGTGTAPMVALRGTRAVSYVAQLEGGIVAAFPEHQLGGQSTLLASEVQLQFMTPGWISPYVGFGGGFVVHLAPEEAGGTDFDITMSGGLGVRAALDERLGVQVDGRLRGVGAGLHEAAFELSAGIAWRFTR